jgi:hypothetical protein
LGAVEVFDPPAARVGWTRTALERDADERVTSRAELRGKTEFWDRMSRKVQAIC